MQDYVYDIEIYSNFFLMCAQAAATNEKRSFEISPRKVQTKELMEFLNEEIRLFGFNCVNYDGLILQKLLENLGKNPKDLVAVLKQHSDKIIRNEQYAKFAKKFVKVPNIDLFLINHFDNDAKRTSLKDLEFVFGMNNIQELPFDYTKPVTKEQMAVLEEYCWNDIEATFKLYHYTKEEIDLRTQLSELYNINMMSYNSPKLGEIGFCKELIKMNPTFEQKLKLQSKRDKIELSKIIFSYISFQTEGFQKLLNYLKSKVITDTYKVFSELPFEDLKEIEGHYNVHKTKGVQKNLNIVHKNFEFVFGTGGIHGCIEPGIYISDDEYDIIDIDVASYYPNLAIKNKVYPEHLGEEFCVVYEHRFEERKKHPKGSVLNNSIKLELNGVYGKSNSKYSSFYDSQYTMTITINGQLLIAMLAEQLMEVGQLLQANTDGVTVRVHKSLRYVVEDIIAWWQNLTGLTLESVNYSKMIIKDVSNYLAVSTEGKIKRKGAAFKTTKELELHENHSGVVVQEAISAYFIDSVDPTQFLLQELEENGLSKFFMRAKVKREHQLIARMEEEDDIPLQRITRYIVTNTGVSLIKRMPPLPKKPDKWRENEVEAGWKVTVCNNLSTVNMEELKGNINLEYYLTQIYKVINAIEKQNTE